MSFFAPVGALSNAPRYRVTLMADNFKIGFGVSIFLELTPAVIDLDVTQFERFDLSENCRHSVAAPA